jgi:hypothetical protein
VEEKVTNISESIQGFHACIMDMESHVTPSMPSEERETRKKILTTSIENIKKLEVEFVKLYI